METKTKKSKLNINALISFGGALIILSLATKLLHFSWADKFMVAAFILEALLFMLMGFQKIGEDQSASSGGGTINDVQFNSEDSALLSQEIKNALISLTRSSESNMMFNQALMDGVGMEQIIQKMSHFSKIPSLNIQELQDLVSDNAEKMRELNECLDTLTRIHLNQINALRQTR